MSNVLMVPIHLDALHLTHERFVTEPMVDFSKMPYFDGSRDVNPDTPNISEELVSQPFQNQNLFLKAGIHLHWALPDALTKGHHSESGTNFPSVPNRWLITRRKDNILEKQWIVESDYLYPTGEGDGLGSIAYPYTKAKPTDPPFRFLGRKFELSAWDNVTDAEYLPKLTAVGYGEPTFAAFYPNCHSVFGFHDDDYISEVPNGLQYEVIGWYSDNNQDPLTTLWLLNQEQVIDWGELRLNLYKNNHLPHVQRFWALLSAKFKSIVRKETNAFTLSDADKTFVLNELVSILKRKDFYVQDAFLMVQIPEAAQDVILKDASVRSATEVGTLNKRLLEVSFPNAIMQYPEALKNKFSWIVDDDSPLDDMQMLCFSQLTFQPAPLTTNPAYTSSNMTVAVANSSTEALSALLAERLAGEHKSIIEDQLEAILLTEKLQDRQLDIGQKFKEARHEKEFNAVSGGLLWTVRLESGVSKPADAKESATQSQDSLPFDMAATLNHVNKLQQQYDSGMFELESLRKQTFSDWYKYMLCAYPPEDSRDDYPNIDAVKKFIEAKDLDVLEQKQKDIGRLLIQYDAIGNVTDITSEGSPTSVAFQLAAALNALRSSVEEHNRSEKIKDSNYFYQLKQTSGPRYWQPKDPVVLVTGDSVKPSPRHGQDDRLRTDGLLECHLLVLQEKTLQGSLPQNFGSIAARIRAIKDNVTANHFAYETWSTQPWHPFLLEWQVEVFPRKDQNNLNPEHADYSSTFLTDNYALNLNATELTLKTGKASIVKADSSYTGRSILTPHASINLKEKLVTYFLKNLPNDTITTYYKAKRIKNENRNTTWLRQNMLPFIEWYLSQDAFLNQYFITQNISSANKNLKWLRKNVTDLYNWSLSEIKKQPPRRESFYLLALMLAYTELFDLNCLAQSLGGFNEALLMEKQTMQLDIEDPIGFEDYKDFTGRVKIAVQNSFRTAPQPQNDFNPIRSGILRPMHLQLIDTFGQVKSIDVTNITTIEKMRTPDNGNLVTLPPRFTQSARVNFRWLSAQDAKEEMNAHPATTPICGWILTNHLDNSVMFYDNLGHGLGSIDQKAHWRAVPGSAQPIDIEQIPNVHLKKMVKTILNLGESFLRNFISIIDNAMETIEPENFAEHQDLALLMGRPIALVRASLDLQLHGTPARHQGWNTFRLDLKRNYRETDAFVNVKVPIRIGEYQQLNDGLVGFWIEQEDTYRNNTFYAPQSNIIPHDNIRTHQNGPLNILQSFFGEPHILSVLMDPRGKIHATSGVLPTKEIHIPPDQYASALQAINITFLSTPVIGDSEKISLPLPGEPGYIWSWLDKNKDSWTEVSSVGTLERSVLLKTFPSEGNAIWEELKSQEWIEEIDSTKARVIAKDQRKAQELNNFKQYLMQIENILDSSHIGKINTKAAFSGRPKIREGWLKLSKDNMLKDKTS